MTLYKYNNNILLFLIIFVGIIVILEVSSFAFFKIRKDRFTFSSPSEFTLTDDEIIRVAKTFDSKLGWSSLHQTPFGERPRDTNYTENIMSTFGDSYTFCDEVKDNETWQNYLSEKLNKNIFNFGTGAYGTDQSLMRFREDRNKVSTKYITLGLITENMNRLVNVYRKFYLPSTGMPATKPRFELINSQLSFIKNPIANIGELQKLKDEKFISKIGADDFWYNRANRPQFSFPYTSIFLNRNIWYEIKHGNQGDKIDSSTPMIRSNPWENPNIRQLMFAIFDSFVTETKQSGSIPVILLFPLDFEILQTIQTRTPPPTILSIIKYCQSKGYNIFCPINELAAEVVFKKNTNLFAKGGHYSANGNKTLAKYLHLYFQQI